MWTHASPDCRLRRSTVAGAVAIDRRARWRGAPAGGGRSPTPARRGRAPRAAPVRGTPPRSRGGCRPPAAPRRTRTRPSRPSPRAAPARPRCPPPPAPPPPRAPAARWSPSPAPPRAPPAPPPVPPSRAAPPGPPPCSIARSPRRIVPSCPPPAPPVPPISPQLLWLQIDAPRCRGAVALYGLRAPRLVDIRRFAAARVAAGHRHHLPAHVGDGDALEHRLHRPVRRAEDGAQHVADVAAHVAAPRRLRGV